MGAHDLGTLPHLGVLQRGVGTDGGTGSDVGGAQQLGAREDRRIGGDGDVDVDPCGVGVDDGDSGAHELLALAAVELLAEVRQLHAVVRPFDLPQVVGGGGGDGAAGLPGVADDVGEVLLALRVVSGQRGQAFPERGGVEGVDAGVDLTDGPLGLVRVLLLDDAQQGAGFVADDAAVPGRVVHLGGQDGDGVGVGFVDFDEARDRLGGQQRHIAVGDDDGSGEVLGQLGQRAFGGASGARNFVLVGDEQGPLGGHGKGVEVGDELIALVADDDDEMFRRGSGRCCDGVMKQGASADGMHHLGKSRLHSSALARCQDDDGGRMSLRHS